MTNYIAKNWLTVTHADLIMETPAGISQHCMSLRPCCSRKGRLFSLWSECLRARNKGATVTSDNSLSPTRGSKNLLVSPRWLWASVVGGAHAQGSAHPQRPLYPPPGLLTPAGHQWGLPPLPPVLVSPGVWASAEHRGLSLLQQAVTLEGTGGAGQVAWGESPISCLDATWAPESHYLRAEVHTRYHKYNQALAFTRLPMELETCPCSQEKERTSCRQPPLPPSIHHHHFPLYLQALASRNKFFSLNLMYLNNEKKIYGRDDA